LNCSGQIGGLRSGRLIGIIPPHGVITAREIISYGSNPINVKMPQATCMEINKVIEIDLERWGGSQKYCLTKLVANLYEPKIINCNATIAQANNIEHKPN
jgi:hypothetical protein